MMYELVVTADYNDADYVTMTESISEEELIRFKPVFDAIVAKTQELKTTRQYHNFWTFRFTRGERELPYNKMYSHLDHDLLEEFMERFVPRGGDSDYGIHTIDSIVYYPEPQKTVIL